VARTRDDVVAEMASAGVIGIVRESDAGRARTVADALLAGGLQVIEITLTTPGATDLVADLVASRADDGVLVGAGTVLDEGAAVRCIHAGADFLVSPHLPAAVVRAAHRHGIAAIPGAATVHEAMSAIEHGADAVKLFPAGVHGLDWFRALRSVLPPIPLVPTGGITPADVPDWLAAAAPAGGLGGQPTAGGEEEIVARVADVVGRSHAVGAVTRSGVPGVRVGRPGSR
jgi:2-dehydro-3-deoxyphosphogluconate aldolase / (4S)-4-hydroxy-2-oxoglutarate aldolase